MLWRTFLLVWTILATTTEHVWFFTLLATDCFIQNPQMATVLHAVVNPWLYLVMTSFGGCIIVLAYAAVGFMFFREDFGIQCNESIFGCAQSIMYQSTRNGIIGLSSMMTTVMPDDDKWMQRMLYDISFFIITGIMVLNTVVALIVDSFGFIRRANQARDLNRDQEAFICCLDRKLIERAAQYAGISNGFQYHEEQRQPKWTYMAFIFRLYEKKTSDYTGPEHAVRSLIEEEDIKWMPLGRSKLVENAQDYSSEDILRRIELQSKNLITEVSGGTRVKSNLLESMNNFGNEINEQIENMQVQIAHLLQLNGGMTPGGGPHGS